METKSPWVAVVDDNPAIRRAMVRLLRSAGIDAQAFSCGKSFLRSISANPPFSVILDVHMPDQSGIEVQAILQSLAPQIGVILISGFPKPQEQFRASHEMPLAYLQKPVSDQLLLNAIAQTYRLGATT